MLSKVENFTRQKVSLVSQIPAWDGIEAQSQPLDLMVEQWGSPAAPPERTYLLVHGITANLRWWDTLAEALLSASPKPIRLIAVDLRGRGDSDKPATPYSVTTEAADLAALLEVLGINAPINYVGHSLGAHIGTVFASHYPQYVRRLALLDGGTVLAEDVGESIAPALRRVGQLYPDYAAFVAPLKSAGFIPNWNEYTDRAYRYDVETRPDGVISKVSPTAIEQEVRHLMTFYQIVSDLYPNIPAPVLLVRATLPVVEGLQPFVPLSALEEMRRILPGGLQVIEVAANHYTVLLEPTSEMIQALLS